MPGQTRTRTTTALLSSLLLALLAPPAHAQIRLDLPSQPLGTSLTAIGTLGHLNVLFDPSVVDGLQAPALKAELSADDALTRLLAGTSLHAVHVNENTIRVVPEPSKRARSTGATETGAVLSAEHLRLAYAGRDATEGPQPSDPADASQAPNGLKEDSSTRSREKVEEVVVTGSRLSRPPGEAAQDVRIYSRDQIDQSGQTTVAAFVNSLPSVSVGVQESFANYFGGTTVNLRGLPFGSTLILIDGHRVETSGTQINQNFFDLNNIPLSAVERIEVLSSGASAIYGSDAVAGVVNIILKKHFDGVELESKYGFAKNNHESDSSIALGRDWDRGHISIVGSYQYRSELSGADRKLTASNDYTSYGGPNNNFPICNAADVFSTTGNNLPGLTSSYAAVPAGFTGTPTRSEFSGTQGTLNDCSIQSAHASLIPETRRMGLLLNGDYEFASDATLFVEALFAHNSQTLREGPQFLFALPIFQLFTVSATNPYNPFGESVGVGYQFAGNDADYKFTTNYFRPVVGIRGSLGEQWNWEVSMLYSRDATTLSAQNYSENNALIQAALDSADPQTALNPFITGPPNLSPSVVSAFFNPAHYDYIGDRTALTATASGPLLTLPAGAVQIAVGSEVSRDALSTTQDLTFTTNNPVSTSYSRRTAAVFGEVRIPILARTGGDPGALSSSVLAATIAARYDHYSDFGSTTNPQFALEWRPFRDLLIRGGYADSFEAPSLYSLYSPVGSVNVLVTDPQTGTPTLVPTKTGGNAGLHPQTGHSEALGFVYSPTQLPQLRLSVTHWRILEKSTIQNLSAQVIVDSFPDRVLRDPATSQILAVDSTLANSGRIDVAGLDYAIRYSLPTRFGTWSSSIEATQTYRYLTQLIPGGVPTESVAKASDTGDWSPRWKHFATLGWQRGRFVAQVTGRYVGSYQDYDSTRSIGNFWLFDSSLKVALGGHSAQQGETGGAEVAVGAVNLFNRAPQYSSFTRNFVGYDPSQADIRGRFLYLDVRYRFD